MFNIVSQFITLKKVDGLTGLFPHNALEKFTTDCENF